MKHRSKIAVRTDFTKPWSLPMFLNPSVKRVIVKCEMCNPRPKPYKRATAKKQANQIVRDED